MRCVVLQRGKVVTMEALRCELARLHGVGVVCPFYTKQALRAIAETPKGVSFWRLVASDGRLLKYLPGGAEGHAAKLAEELVPLKPGANGRKISNLKAFLHVFAPNEQ